MNNQSYPIPMNKSAFSEENCRQFLNDFIIFNQPKFLIGGLSKD